MKSKWIFLLAIGCSITTFATNINPHALMQSLLQLSEEMREQVIARLDEETRTLLKKAMEIPEEQIEQSAIRLAELFKKEQASFDEKTKTLTIGSGPGANYPLGDITLRVALGHGAGGVSTKKIGPKSFHVKIPYLDLVTREIREFELEIHDVLKTIEKTQAIVNRPQ